MKISLTGTQGVGKTTVLNELSHIYPQFNIITEVVRDLSSTGVNINEGGDDKSQYTIFNTYLELFDQNKSYVSDRGLVDVVAYDRYLYKHKKINQIVLLDHQQQLVEFIKKNPDVVHIYFPIEFDLVDDGVRSTNKEFQKEIDTHVANILNEYDINHINVSGSVEERVKQIKKYINNMTKTNSVNFNENVKSPDLKPSYDEKFAPSREYLDSMPDIQNDEFIGLAIEQVGIHNFKMPLYIARQEGNPILVTASITGSVSLEAEKRGINMSRIIRTFYSTSRSIGVFSVNSLIQVLKDYRKDLESFDANIQINFEYPIWIKSLRSVDSTGSPEGGYQFYNILLDVNMDKLGDVRKVVYLDYIYSSTCPCSYGLSKHARDSRGAEATPHAQRSIARVGIEFEDMVWFEEIIDLCRLGQPTETQVFVKREDEQAFAELCAANLSFVEDAVRSITQALDTNESIIDYRVLCSHQESLHSHDAIALRTKGLINSKFIDKIAPYELQSMKV